MSSLRELQDGNPKQALTLISDLEFKILNAGDDLKTEYYYIKGTALMMLAKQNKNKQDKVGLGIAIDAYQELLLIESLTKVYKYSRSVNFVLSNLKNQYIHEAEIASKTNNYKLSALKFYEAYKLNRHDWINLYYAGLASIRDNNLLVALEYFKDLKANFSIRASKYYAINKITGADDEFISKRNRDNAIISGTHERLRTEKLIPRKENILKKIAVIHLLDRSYDNAKKALIEFNFHNKYDKTFDLAELKLYMETGDYLNFSNILLDRIIKNPNDAHLYYYLGLLNNKLRHKNEAKEYFKKAQLVDPSYKFKNDEKLTSYDEALKMAI